MLSLGILYVQCIAAILTDINDSLELQYSFDVTILFPFLLDVTKKKEEKLRTKREK